MYIPTWLIPLPLVLKNTKGLKPTYKMLGLLIISVAYVIFLVKVINLGTRKCLRTESAGLPNKLLRRW